MNYNTRGQNTKNRWIWGNSSWVFFVLVLCLKLVFEIIYTHTEIPDFIELTFIKITKKWGENSWTHTLGWELCLSTSPNMRLITSSISFQHPLSGMGWRSLTSAVEVLCLRPISPWICAWCLISPLFCTVIVPISGLWQSGSNQNSRNLPNI